MSLSRSLNTQTDMDALIIRTLLVGSLGVFSILKLGHLRTPT